MWSDKVGPYIHYAVHNVTVRYHIVRYHTDQPRNTQCSVDFPPRHGAVGQVGGESSQNTPVPARTGLGHLTGKHVPKKKRMQGGFELDSQLCLAREDVATCLEQVQEQLKMWGQEASRRDVEQMC